MDAVEALHHMPRTRRTAGDHEAELTAELHLHHVHHRSPETDLHQELRHLRLPKAVLDLLMKLLREERNRAEDRRLRVVDVLPDRAEGLHEHHRAAAHQRHHEVRLEGERVEKRQHDEEGVVGRELAAEELERSLGVGDEVRVRQHRALRLAGRTRRVDDRGNVPSLGDMGVIPGTSSRQAKLGIFDDIDSIVDLLSVMNNAVDNHNASQVRKFLGNRHHHLEMSRIRRHDTDARVLENVGNLVVMELRINRYHRDARAALREIGLHPGRTVRQNDRGVLVARLEPEPLSVTLSDLANALEHLAVAARLPDLALAIFDRHGLRPGSRPLFK